MIYRRMDIPTHAAGEFNESVLHYLIYKISDISLYEANLTCNKYVSVWRDMISCPKLILKVKSDENHSVQPFWQTLLYKKYMCNNYMQGISRVQPVTLTTSINKPMTNGDIDQDLSLPNYSHIKEFLQLFQAFFLLYEGHIKRLVNPTMLILSLITSNYSKSVVRLFIFETQMKIFFMKSESFLTLHRQQCNKAQKCSEDIDKIVHVTSVVQP